MKLFRSHDLIAVQFFFEKQQAGRGEELATLSGIRINDQINQMKRIVRIYFMNICLKLVSTGFFNDLSIRYSCDYKAAHEKSKGTTLNRPRHDTQMGIVITAIRYKKPC